MLYPELFKQLEAVRWNMDVATTQPSLRVTIYNLIKVYAKTVNWLRV